MAMIYIPDDLITKVINIGTDKSKFVKEAIEEKLKQDKIRNLRHDIR